METDDKMEGRYIKAFGLSRHAPEEDLGSAALTLHVDLRKLVRIAVHAPRHVEKWPSSLAFIWDGSWEERREDLRVPEKSPVLPVDFWPPETTATRFYGILNRAPPPP